MMARMYILYKINNNLEDEYLSVSSELYDLIEFGLNWYNKSNKLLNINISTVNFKLQGKSDFKVNELKTLADHYKVNVNIFFTN